MSKRCKDHLGNSFKSTKEMCEYWGIKQTAFYNRVKKGLKLNEALAPTKNRECAIDHLGNKFKSMNEMCRHWGVSSSTFLHRRENGLSIEECLIGIKPVSDHLGNKFKSIKEMCEYWGINYTTYFNRVRLGLDIKNVLTLNLNEQYKETIDHTGMKFSSIKSMCEYWGVDTKTYGRRIVDGWSVKDALTKPIKNMGKDNEGIKDLCKQKGISYSGFRYRLNQGMTSEEALEKQPKRLSPIHVFGRCYESYAEIARDFNIKHSKLLGRISGKNAEKFKHIDSELLVSLNSIVNMQLKFIGLDGQARYKVSWSQEYQTTRKIIDHERPDLLDLYDKVHPKGEWNPYSIEIGD